MDCMVLAGGTVPPDDPLFPYTLGKPKAFIDMGGRTMLERVVAGLHSSNSVDEVLVVGVDERPGLKFARPVTMLPDQNGLVANIYSGLEWLQKHRPKTEILLGCSADIPAISGPNVNAFVEACRPWDRAIYYNFVTREAMEQRFPGSRRTYSRIEGREVAGGDMVIARIDVAGRNRELVQSLVGARKKPWRVASIVGFGMLARFILRRLTIHDIEERSSSMIGAPVKIIMEGPPELAMDADRPFQVDLLRAEFAQNQLASP